jgi:hypothetical protein
VGTDVAGVAHHATSCLTRYAQDLVAGTTEVGTFDLVRRPDVELGREPVSSWRWHCAPLAEWNGTQPQ